MTENEFPSLLSYILYVPPAMPEQKELKVGAFIKSILIRSTVNKPSTSDLKTIRLIKTVCKSIDVKIESLKINIYS